MVARACVRERRSRSFVNASDGATGTGVHNSAGCKFEREGAGLSRANGRIYDVALAAYMQTPIGSADARKRLDRLMALPQV